MYLLCILVFFSGYVFLNICHGSEIQVLVLVISGLLFMVFSLYVSFSPNFWVRDQGIREALFSGTLSLMDNALFLMKVILKRYFQLFIGLARIVFFYHAIFSIVYRVT